MENSCLEPAGAREGQLCKVALVTFTFSLVQLSLIDTWSVTGGGRWNRLMGRGMVSHDTCYKDWFLMRSSSTELQGISRRGGSGDQPAQPYRY